MLKFLFSALVALSLSLGQPLSVMETATEQLAPAKVDEPIQYIAPDGYYFETATENNSQFYVRIHVYKNYDDLGKAWTKAGGTEFAPGRRVAAFSKRSNDRKTCDIHMIDPKIEYRPQFIGHELVHCTYGSFHSSQKG
jgi:hypothetical protein